MLSWARSKLRARNVVFVKNKLSTELHGVEQKINIAKKSMGLVTDTITSLHHQLSGIGF
jgi:hypothetical protein